METTPKSVNFTRFTIVAAGLFAAAASAHASVVSEDHFATGGSDYTVGGLNAQSTTNGVTGFTGAWTADANYSVTGTGLTLGSLTTSGGAVTFGPTTNATAVKANRTASNPGTGTTYVSFLVRSEADSMTGSQAALNLGGIRVAGMLNGKIMGYVDGSETSAVNSNFASNKTYLFVLKITPNLSGGTRDGIQTWYFNADSAQNLAAADPVISSNTTTEGYLDSSAGAGTGPNIITGTGVWNDSGTIGFLARGQAAGWTTGNLIMDELKVGSSWGDVVAAVPEPSEMAAGAGILALCAAALRRRMARRS